MNAIQADLQVDETALGELSASFTGELIRPRGPTYDEHRRVWNGSIDRSPALIARCAGAADVRTAVGFARDTGLLVAVRSGGHSYPGLSACDGGISDTADQAPLPTPTGDPHAEAEQSPSPTAEGTPSPGSETEAGESPSPEPSASPSPSASGDE